MSTPTQHRFVELYAAHQDRIYSYVYTLAPRWSDAEEIMAQTTLTLWEKWDQFDPQREFMAWACGVARLEALKFFEKSSRARKVLSPEVMDLIAREHVAAGSALSRRADALERCLEKLSSDQKKFVLDCYGGEQMQHVAERQGISIQALYSKLRRVRVLLHDCVDRALAVEEGQ